MKKRNCIAGILAIVLLGNGLCGCSMNQNDSEQKKRPKKVVSDEVQTKEEVKTVSTTVESEEDTKTVVETTEETSQEQDSSSIENDNNEDGQIALSQDELDFFTEWAREASHYGFLLSYYDDVCYADYDEVFYAGAGFEYNPDDGKELLSVVGSIETDVTKLTTEQINEFLYNNARIDIGKIVNFDMIYIPEYDAYYSEHGDTNYMSFECVSGTKDGDIYVLHMVPQEDYCSESDLTLCKEGNDYIVVSNIIEDEGKLEDSQGWYSYNYEYRQSDNVEIEVYMNSYRVVREHTTDKDDNGNIIFEKNTYLGKTDLHWWIWNGQELVNEIFVDYGGVHDFDSDNDNTDTAMYGCFMHVKEEVSKEVDYSKIKNLEKISYNKVGEVDLVLDENDLSCRDYKIPNYDWVEKTISINVVPAIGKHVGDSFYRTEYLWNGKVKVHKYTILSIN